MRKNQTHARQIAKDILYRTKQLFEQHNAKMDQLNRERNDGGRFHKNDKSDRVYEKLGDVIVELDSIAKRLRECQKLRAERREFYQGKLADFKTSIEKLVEQKGIRIRVNEAIDRLMDDTLQRAKEVNTNLKLYRTQSDIFCFSNVHNIKISVQRSLMQLLQHAFLIGQIGRFESVANDSVKEIYMHVEYNENVFKDIENDILRLWPSEKQPASEPKPKAQEPIQKESTELQEAHEYLFGFTRPQNVAKAIKIYHKEAERKPTPNATALNALGSLHEQGKYVSKDSNKAMDYFMRSAKMNDGEGLYKVGKFLQAGNLNTHKLFAGLYGTREAELRGSIDYYERAAQLGHLDAITDLGYIYEKGVKGKDGNCYIEPHLDFAFKYYMLAKKEGFPRAYNNIGSLCIAATETAQQGEQASIQKGLKYLEQAVLLKYPKAFLNLGRCYLSGVGIAPNLQRARSLFQQGGELGDVQSRLEYVRSFLGGSVGDKRTMMDLMETTRQVLLVDRNNAEALYFMGVFEQCGIGTAANKESSYYYISEAAELDYPPALTKLGDYFYSGYFVEKDLAMAEGLYRKAAEKMNSLAIVNLGVMAEKGTKAGSVLTQEKDLQKAQEYYKHAAQLGNETALLFMDIHSKENTKWAVQNAAEKGNAPAIKLMNKTVGSLLYPPVAEKPKHQNTLRKLATHYVNGFQSK